MKEIINALGAINATLRRIACRLEEITESNRKEKQ
jgi:hypothetical protein